MASASNGSRPHSRTQLHAQLESAAWIYFRPECQFRPLRRTGLAPYHTRVAAGIRRTNDFVPTYSATIPSNISRTDHPIDFFEFALMINTRFQSLNVSTFQSEERQG
jgi:hypothetical protein